MDLVDLTAKVGDAIVKFRDWIKTHDVLKKTIKILSPIIKDLFSRIKAASTAVSEWVKNNEKLQNVFKIIRTQFTKISEAISKWTKGLKETDRKLLIL